MSALDPLAAELDGLVDLTLERSQADDRIEQAGRADDLLDDQIFALCRAVEIIDALRGANVVVSDSPAGMGQAMQEAMSKA